MRDGLLDAKVPARLQHLLGVLVVLGVPGQYQHRFHVRPRQHLVEILERRACAPFLGGGPRAPRRHVGQRGQLGPRAVRDDGIEIEEFGYGADPDHADLDLARHGDAFAVKARGRLGRSRASWNAKFARLAERAHCGAWRARPRGDPSNGAAA